MTMCLKMPTTSEMDSSGVQQVQQQESKNNEKSNSEAMSAVEDTEASDEVKVYCNEEEEAEDDLRDQTEAKVKSSLSDDKSTLITESEQSKEPPRGHHDLAFASRLLDPALTATLNLHQYLLNASQHASAIYAAGLGMNRSSLWAENALTGGASPTSVPHPGLRPPLYHLPPPPPHGQYPYSAAMLGSDQLAAAWHQQAAAYHQAGALRAGSPYTLPISAAQRFSPGGLLGPGLPPAASSSGGHHLPHIKPDLDATGAGHHHHGSSGHHGHHGHHGHRGGGGVSGGHHHEKESKKKENHIKKPLNAFMLYMKEMRPVVQAECTLKESAAINQILGRRWHDLSREEQAKYYEKARSERQKHMEMYPHWNARDNYRFGLKKKKRKRDKTDDPAASMKKCRARYGLDQQDAWCRPCRRKKKCIRVQNYIEGKGNNGNSSSGAAGAGALANMAGMAGMTSAAAPPTANPSSLGIVGQNSENLHRHKNGQRSGLSDGEDDLEDEEDESPDSRSLGSTSEQSLTSPAGFSSLNSLGSPASIASPSTPSGFEAAVSQADLFRPSVFGAFKPPSTSVGPGGGGGNSVHYPASSTSAASAAASAAAAHHQMLLHQHQQQQMFQHLRPPVGTDPRDSKNPLSISQLTGNFCSPPIGGHPGHHHHGHHPSGHPGGHPSTDKRALPLMT